AAGRAVLTFIDDADVRVDRRLVLRVPGRVGAWRRPTAYRRPGTDGRARSTGAGVSRRRPMDIDREGLGAKRISARRVLAACAVRRLVRRAVRTASARARSPVARRARRRMGRSWTAPAGRAARGGVSRLLSTGAGWIRLALVRRPAGAC